MITENIAWGIRGSMTVAVGFAVIVIVEYLVLGPGTTSRLGVTLPTVLLTYAGGGTLAGIVLGIGRPLTKTRVGSMILGVFVATCAYGSFAIAMYGLPNHWHGDTWFVAILLGVFVGALGGENLFYKLG
jgi:hypothetical protein